MTHLKQHNARHPPTLLLSQDRLDGFLFFKVNNNIRVKATNLNSLGLNLDNLIYNYNFVISALGLNVKQCILLFQRFLGTREIKDMILFLKKLSLVLKILVVLNIWQNHSAEGSPWPYYLFLLTASSNHPALCDLFAYLFQIH